MDNLASLLQRKLSNIVLLCASSVSLTSSNYWDPDTQEISEDFIDFDIPSFFGVIPADYLANTFEYDTYDLTRSQFFSKSDWSGVIKSLQAAQNTGNGVVVSTPLVTVANDFYGIPAGQKVTVTWVYICRATEWEKRLSPDMQSVTVPTTQADNLGHNIESGPFKGFPNFGTAFANLDDSQSNLLADFVGWTVLNNKDVFINALK